jgi:dienelactone hydrolase
MLYFALIFFWCFHLLGQTGFVLNGQNWTYDPGDGGEMISGVLVQPTVGMPPYPAVLISHGQGGSATSFGLSKATIMKQWGFLCIAPNYTHTNTSYAIGADGWSPENERRARACVTILNSLGTVDTNRIAAYGHSKGAFVTAGFCGATNNRIAVAAITAGGTTGTSDTTPASPAAQEVQGIRIPFLMQHGTDDTTVFPVQSATLQSILISNAVVAKRILYQDMGHNIETDPLCTNAVFNSIREWFIAKGILVNATNTPPTISALTNLTSNGLVLSNVALTCADAETVLSNLRFQLVSTVPAVIPTNNIAITGSGSNRFITFSALTNGVTTIGISVSDGQLTATTVFDVTVVTGPVTNGPPTSSTNFAVGRPRGIYILDSAASTTNINGVAMRDSNIRNVPFVSGYLLRASWEDMEPQAGQYDFTIIDWNVRKLAALGQKLSLWTLTIDPPWLAQTAGVSTWFDTDPRVNHWRAVPWDPYLLQRLSAFVNALAEHSIDGVKVKDHPVVNTVNFGVAGAMLAIRDPLALHIRDMTNYTRANFTNAVMTNLRIVATNFPTKFIQVGFWPVADSTSNPSLWDSLRLNILSEFDGIRAPRVGFWMENLSASRSAPGQDPVSGKPMTSFASPEFASQTNTWNGFQALTSWSKPFNNYNDSVTNATPGDGLNFAFSTYGATYFELYVTDIEMSAYTNELALWQQRLVTPQPVLSAATSTTNITLTWNRLASTTTIDGATNVSGPYLPVTTVTNTAQWSLPLTGSNRLFLRLRQKD